MRVEMRVEISSCQFFRPAGETGGKSVKLLPQALHYIEWGSRKSCQ